MKLTKLTARNFQGSSFELVLADLNFLVGANFRGKTTRLNAITFLLLGYLPALGKTGAASFGLASGREMEVSGEFDTGDRIRRRLVLKGDRVSREEEIPESLKDCGHLALMMDSGAYFSLSGPERTAYVAANCPADQTVSIDDLIERVTNKVGKIPWALGATPEDMTPQDFVGQQIERGAEKQRELKAYAERMEKTVQGLGDLRLSDVPIAGEAGLESAIAKIVAEIADINEERGRHSAAWDEQKRTANRRQHLLAQPNTAQAAVRLADAADGLKAALKVQDELGTAPSAAAVAAADKAKTGAALAVGKSRDEWSRLGTEVTSLKTELQAIQSKEKCPYCGAEGIGWRTIRENDLNEQIKQLTLRRDVVVEEGKKAKTELDAAVLAHNRLVVAKDQHPKAQHDVDMARATLVTAEANLRTARSNATELAQLPAQDPNLQAKIETLDTQLRVKQGEKGVLEEKRKAIDKRRNDLQRLAEAEKNRDDSKKDIEICKAAIEEFKVIREELVDGAFKPLLETANSFFGRVLLSPIGYRDGEIGSWRAGQWISHATMSGSERALVYAALQAALTTQSPVRIMCLDELGRMDEATLGNVITCLMHALEGGRIDSVVGIDSGRLGIYRDAEGACRDSKITCSVTEFGA